jgi:hypothetical protein
MLSFCTILTVGALVVGRATGSLVGKLVGVEAALGTEVGRSLAGYALTGDSLGESLGESLLDSWSLDDSLLGTKVTDVDGTSLGGDELRAVDDVGATLGMGSEVAWFAEIVGLAVGPLAESG